MEKEYVYLMTDGDKYKIGKTNDVKKRYKSLRTGNPDLTLLGYTDMFKEKDLHNKYKDHHYKLEWFNFDSIEILTEVLNDFHETNEDLVLRYFKKYNMIREKTTGKYVAFNPTGYSFKEYDRFLSKTGKYKLGSFTFKDKLNMTRFLRSLLNDLPLDEIIIDKDIISLVEELIQNHPKYDRFLETGYKHLKVILDTDSSPTYGTRYSNFCFVFFDDTQWNFSNKKCIDNMGTKIIRTTKKKTIKSTEPKYVKNKYFNSDYIITFGMNKDKSIDDLLLNDKGYLKWAYETITDFKKFIDKTKYKNLFKININQDNKLKS